MKKQIVATLFVASLLILNTSNVYASGGGSLADWLHWLFNLIKSIDWGSHGGHSGGGGGNSVPELDLTAGPIAVALLAAIIGVGMELRRRGKK